MSTKAIHIERISRAEWIDTWHASEYATFYEHPDWFDCWKVMYPGSDGPIALRIALDEDISMIVPCFKRKLAKGLFSKFECSPGGLYAGPLGLKETMNQVQFESIRDALIKEFNDISFRFNPFITAGISLPSDTRLFTQLVDLNKPDEITEKFQHSGVAYDARTAKRKGLHLKMTDKNDIQKFLQVYDELKSTWDNPTSDYPLDFLNSLISSGHCDFWSLSHRDNYIGGGIILKGPYHASSWLTIMHPESTKLRPYEFTYVNLIKHYSEIGIRWFDFNPSAGLEGVVKFKDKFSTKRLHFGQFESVGSMSSLISAIRGEKP